MRFKSRLTSVLGLAALIFTTHAAWAQPISITESSPTYTQNFDGLGTSDLTWADDATLPGWWSNDWDRHLRATNGTTAAEMHNFGSGGSDPDRALGAKTHAWWSWAAQFVNDASQPVESVDVTFVGETWRIIGGAAPSEIQVYYKVGGGFDLGTSSSAPGWTHVSELTYVGATGANTVNNQGDTQQAVISGTIPVALNPGERLWIAFRTNPVANHNLAVDDFHAEFTLTPPPPTTPDIPSLAWTERSDWINVKADVSPAAVGDGVADDTAALQAAINMVDGGSSGPKVVYLPPGAYRITSEIQIPSSVGLSIIGHGRDTVIRWDGAAGGRMFLSRGATQANYIGLSYDGAGLANVIFDHEADLRFEASVQHKHCAFRNANVGLLGGAAGSSVNASSEMTIDNCLFENLVNAGIRFYYYNYYNETVTRCVFRNCGYGIENTLGNGYYRACHFEGSTIADFRLESIHGHSIRRCTSVGSNRFLFTNGKIPSVTIQDCKIDSWTNTNGAIVVHLNHHQPMLVFDTEFTNPPGSHPPINAPAQQLMLSNVTSPQTTSVTLNDSSPTYVPAGARTGVTTSASQSFLDSTVAVPSVVFDAVQDFGALSGADDTAAVQACIDAARNHGQGAIAYFPVGRYKLYGTIDVSGGDYVIGGAGYHTEFEWKMGENGGVMFHVQDPQNIRIEQIALHKHIVPKTVTAIRQTGTGPASIVYDRVWGPKGHRTLGPQEREGLHLVNLPAGTEVYLARYDGILRATESAAATIVAEFMNATGVYVDGATAPKTGFMGIATINGDNLQVTDNNDLVVADFYAEQSGDWGNIGPDMNRFYVAGGMRSGAGRVSIGGAKAHIVDINKLFRVNDYEGVVSFSDANFSFRSPAKHYVVFDHVGTRPVRLASFAQLLGNEPQLYSLDTGAELIRVLDPDRSLQNAASGALEAWWVYSDVAVPTTGGSYALSLDGVNDYVMGPWGGGFTNTTGITVAVWVKRDPASGGWLVKHGQVGNSNSDGWYLQVGDHARFVLRDSSNNTYSSGWSTTQLTEGTWHLVVGTWDGATVRVYVDGGPAEASAPAAFTAFKKGYYARFIAGGDTAGGFVAAALDEVLFYTRSLGDAEIDGLYNAGLGQTAPPTNGLYLHWPMNSGDGVIAWDHGSGDQNHGLLYEHGVNHNPVHALDTLSQVLDHFRELNEWSDAFSQSQ